MIENISTRGLGFSHSILNLNLKNNLGLLPDILNYIKQYVNIENNGQAFSNSHPKNVCENKYLTGSDSSSSRGTTTVALGLGWTRR